MSKAKLKFGVLVANMMVCGAGVTTPLIADFMKFFPASSPTTIMMIASLPSLLMMVFSPLYGKLSQIFPKKGLLVFATVCFVVGGFAPVFMRSIGPILAMRGLLGVGLGFIMPMVSDLVTDFFDGHERETMMGLQGGIASLGGIVYQMVGAYLGKTQLFNCFYAYLLGIVVLILALVTLEEPPKRVAPAGTKASLPGAAYLALLVFLIYNLLWFTLITNTAVFVVGEQLGAPLSIGAIFSVMTVGMLLGGFLLGPIMKQVKALALPLGYLITSIGFGVGYFATGLSGIFVAGFLTGFGIGITVPAFWVKLSTSVPPPVIGLGIGLGIFAMNLGDFIQPIVFEYLLKVLHLHIGRQAFLVSMVALLVLAVGAGLAALLAKQPKLSTQN